MPLSTLSGSRLPWPLALLTLLTSIALICVGSLEWALMAKGITAVLATSVLLAAFDPVPREQLQRQLILRRQAELLIERQAEALRVASPQSQPQDVAPLSTSAETAGATGHNDRWAAA